jgi:hypothetical protein
LEEAEIKLAKLIEETEPKNRLKMMVKAMGPGGDEMRRKNIC